MNPAGILRWIQFAGAAFSLIGIRLKLQQREESGSTSKRYKSGSSSNNVRDPLPALKIFQIRFQLWLLIRFQWWLWFSTGAGSSHFHKMNGFPVAECEVLTVLLHNWPRFKSARATVNVSSNTSVHRFVSFSCFTIRCRTICFVLAVLWASSILKRMVSVRVSVGSPLVSGLIPWPASCWI